MNNITYLPTDRTSQAPSNRRVSHLTASAAVNPISDTPNDVLDSDCILEIYLSPFHQGRLPSSFWQLCQESLTDARWVTWLYPSSSILNRLAQSKAGLKLRNKGAIHPTLNTLDAFRMVHLQDNPTSQSTRRAQGFESVLNAVKLGTSRVVIIEVSALQPDFSGLDQAAYTQLNHACQKGHCQLVLLHSPTH